MSLEPKMVHLRFALNIGEDGYLKSPTTTKIIKLSAKSPTIRIIKGQYWKKLRC